MAEKMGEKIATLVRGEAVELLVPGFEKEGVTITELMLDQIGANSVWAGWTPRLIKHHNPDDFSLKEADEVPAVALIQIERRTEGEEGKSSLWGRVTKWLVDDPTAALQGYIETSPEVYRDEKNGTWIMPFVAALGGELPLQQGLSARFELRGVKLGALADTMAVDEKVDRLWDYVTAFEKAARNIFEAEGGDKKAAIKGLVTELGVLIDGLQLKTALTASAQKRAVGRVEQTLNRISKYFTGNKEVKPKMADNILELLAGLAGTDVETVKTELGAAFAPEVVTPPPDNKVAGQEGDGEGGDGGGDTAVADLVKKFDELAQRIAALEARVDQVTEGAGEGDADADKKAAADAAAAAAAKPTDPEVALRLDLAKDLKAAGVTLGAGGDVSEPELVKAVQAYAAKNSMTFTDAYREIYGRVQEARV